MPHARGIRGGMSQKLQISEHRGRFLAKRHIGAGQPEGDGNHDRHASRRQRRPRQPGKREVHKLHDDQPGRERAGDDSEEGRGRADQQVLDPVRRNQVTSRGAKRFQDHRVVNPMAMAGRKCPAEHQRGGDKRDGAGAADDNYFLALFY